MSAPLLSVRGVSRTFGEGEQATTVLADVNLDVWPGEMIALIGPSGSGKSTLMNILGCLDRPSTGSFRFAGEDVGRLDENERARLRRAHFGFIFQRYQLLPELDAIGNVEIPAIYAGTARSRRRADAARILGQLGLSDRLRNRPSQLSGGQQQRVSVARALINGGEVILADEPTGALDSKSGADLIALLTDLNRRGHTIIIVTHDPEVAKRATRIIEIKDGRILSDSNPTPPAASERMDLSPPPKPGLGAVADRLREALSMALKAMATHRLRTFLTMLGIIIGIAAVVSVVALGTGSKAQVLANIASIGTSTIDVRKGSGFGDRRASAIRTLVPADATALAAQPFARSVSPQAGTRTNVTHGAATSPAQVNGVGAGFFATGAYVLQSGRLFDQANLNARDQVAVIDTNAVKTLFPTGGDPVSQTLLIGRVPVRIIGVVKENGVSFGPSIISIYLPYTTLAARITGQDSIDSIAIRIADGYPMSAAENRITDLIQQRHGKRDFFLTNSDTIRNTITSTAETLTLLVASIAVISLIVGGIGVMNIMLVSVTERTREIGVRMSVGARRSDIVMQFLIEAIIVCLFGGVLGVILAVGGGNIATRIFPDVPLTYSPIVAVAAFVAASAIGIIFGYLPARAASRLDPVVALARE